MKAPCWRDRLDLLANLPSAAVTDCTRQTRPVRSRNYKVICKRVHESPDIVLCVVDVWRDADRLPTHAHIHMRSREPRWQIRWQGKGRADTEQVVSAPPRGQWLQPQPPHLALDPPPQLAQGIADILHPPLQQQPQCRKRHRHQVEATSFA